MMGVVGVEKGARRGRGREGRGEGRPTAARARLRPGSGVTAVSEVVVGSRVTDEVTGGVGEVTGVTGEVGGETEVIPPPGSAV